MLSYEWVDWHLTPGGWVRGSTRLDFGGVEDVDPPSDCVMTVRYEEELSHVRAPMRKLSTTTWVCSDTRQMNKLLARHGECPRHV